MKKQINPNVKAHLIRSAFYLLLVLVVSVIPFALAQRTTAKGNRPATTITVTNGNDSGPGSLRQALADATDGDTINFDASVGSVTLTTAELAITKNVTLSGAPQMVTVARASQTEFRIFHVLPGHSVEIDGLTISGGHITGGNGGGILNDNSTLTIAHCTVQANAIASFSGNNFGGGIHNSGTMTLNQVIVNNNNAPPPAIPSGGGISNTGTMIIIAGTVQGNMGFFSGGGIYNTGMLTITGSTILNNQLGNPGHFGGSGGGIVNYGTMTIQDSTISGNTALGGDLQGGDGGGISGDNNTITNSTITGNSAHHGGGIAGGGNIAHTTFSTNSATIAGGALYLTSSLELGNTILKAGTSGVNIFNNGGTVTSHGYNVCSDNGSGFLNGPGDQINTDPMLGPLQNNGGPTFTHALLPGSPAIDAGDPNFTPPPYYDQRGPVFWRVRNGRIDSGSFEVQAGTTPSPTPTATATPTPTPTPTGTPSCVPNFHILIVSANGGVQPTTLRTSLLAQPGVSTVDFFDGQAGTPTLAQLQAYQIVVAYLNSAFADATAMGNVLADYIDGGGVVVGHTYLWGQFSAIQGRYATGGYNPFVIPTTNDFTPHTLGSCSFAPLCTGVTTLNASNTNIAALSAGAVQAATWNTGQPLIAYKTVNGHTSVGVTAYVGDNPAGTWSGDFAKVIVNAGRFLLTPCPTATPTATAAATATATATPTVAATATATPTLTPRPSPTPRVAPTPRVRPTPPPRL